MNAASPPIAALDHLVVMADTLEQGAAWCRATLGVAPAPGGEHPLFGTHNSLLAIGSAAHPQAYLEIIAIDPAAAPARRRWFDMDQQALRAGVQRDGPRLIHWVARVPGLAAALAIWAARGLDAGPALAASRMTPRGRLEWRIAVRPDGRRLMQGCLPTLIEWGAVHPAASLPDCGVALQSLTLHHPQAAALQGALDAVALGGVQVRPADAVALQARLATPRGSVVLDGGA